MGNKNRVLKTVCLVVKALIDVVKETCINKKENIIQKKA